MLEQLTSQGTESFYAEVSQLIDERHITPASYARRVNGALNHLSHALEVPAFIKAAQVGDREKRWKSFATIWSGSEVRPKYEVPAMLLW